MFSLSALSTAEMLNNFAIDIRIEFRYDLLWYLAIFMTPHLKQQERKNGVWGLGWAGGWVRGGGHKRFCHISGGVENFFQRDWGVVKFFAHHMKM